MKTMLLAIAFFGIDNALCLTCVSAPFVPPRTARNVQNPEPDGMRSFTFDSEWNGVFLPGYGVDICCDRLEDGTCRPTIIVERVRIQEVRSSPNRLSVTVSATAEQVEIMVEAAKRGQLRAILRADDDK